MNFWEFISEPVWNNEFSYNKRKQLWSECKIYIPNIKTINNINKKTLYKELILWDKIVFEEVIDDKVISNIWLSQYIEWYYKWNKLCIFDNHNIAFYFIWKYFLETWKKKDIIHIDQHSDMLHPFKIPKKLDSLELIKKYTLKWINVWNYLIPLQKLWFIWDIKQCRTKFSIDEISIEDAKDKILNIDIDFWEEWMMSTKENLEKVKKMIEKSPLTLIATSPYFINQKKALDIVYNMFD